jgi:superfamily I DNA/RNA helicase/RecB family exonuclease
VNGAPLVLDVHQRAVVDLVAAAGHGPVLVLAGPGTGKTTTLVEAVAARVEAGTDPSRILTLTFSRRAAGELRARIAHRLRRTVAMPLAWTFHGFGFSLVGELLIPDDLGRGLRLLSGPEQEVVVRELLAHDLEIGSVAWPESLQTALRTRGFTEQVRTFMATARSVGLEPDDVARFAQGADQRDDWSAVAQFMVEYLDVIDSRGLLDYSELVSRAVAYAESVPGRAALRGRYDLVLVDEYQDTDPAQERLLQAIAGDGRDLVVVGDPDQSIYGFRGADVGAITHFAERFRAHDGSAAQITSLRVSRRCPEQVLVASRRVASALGAAGSLPTADVQRHRHLLSDADQPPGSVEVRLFSTAEREAMWIAETLRREHLHGGTDWSEMAVLVRSGLTGIPVVARSLAAAGVPVEVASDELPLRDHPALAPLLTLLEYAADSRTLTSDRVYSLLTSPLFGASPGEVRRLGRALRAAHRVRADDDPPPSGLLIRSALVDSSLLDDIPAPLTGHARQLAQTLATLHKGASSGESAHELLWSIWDDSRWSDRLLSEAAGSGQEAAEAHRALDAVVVLFDLAARSHERSPHGDLATFLAEIGAQEIPGAPLSDAGVRGQGVRVMTAHRSKGLEWDVVVVAGVQAEAWPDLRRRGSLLDGDLLGVDGIREPMTVAERRREERRLFYVAITRARRRLICSAVEVPSDEGLRPSPFLDDLGVPIEHVLSGSHHPLTLAGVVAQLRLVATDPDASEVLRSQATSRLALLARAEEADQPLAPAAHPDNWWGRRASSDLSRSDGADISDESLWLSGSQVESLVRCPLQWYLSRRVHAEGGRGTAAGFGGVVHALADAVASGQLPADLGALIEALDGVWGQLQYPADWESDQERSQAVAAIERFLRWHDDARGRSVVSTEEQFSASFSVAGRTLSLSGRLDRLERDADGHLVVVDLKTMSTPPSRHEVATNLQLSTYRHLVSESDPEAVVAAAELVQLRVPAGTKDPGPKVQRQDAGEEADQVLHEALEKAVSTIVSGRFPATPGPACAYCRFTTACPAQPEGREVTS